MTNPLIKTLQEGDELFDKKFRQNTDGEKVEGWLNTDGVILHGEQMQKIAIPNDIKSFNSSRSLKLLEAVAQEYRMMPYLDFGEVLDEAINLYRK